MQLCFATNNKNKIYELSQLLDDSIHLVSLDQIGCLTELEETQNTLEGNSLQKAEFVSKNFEIDVFADDTGLEVFALNNDPGVKSARYAGEQRDNESNIDLLLSNLSEIDSREAQFRTVITLILRSEIHQFEGIVKGEIAKERKGMDGFGYDSVFIPNSDNRTFAQMTMKEKNGISHRGLAVEKLVKFLNTLSFE